jgi:hypothetical protein
VNFSVIFYDKCRLISNVKAQNLNDLNIPGIYSFVIDWVVAYLTVGGDFEICHLRLLEGGFYEKAFCWNSDGKRE